MSKDSDVRVRIQINSDTKELLLAKDEVKRLGNAFNDTDTFANTFLKRLNAFGHAYIGFQTLNNTIGQIATKGFELNKTFQDLTNSLTLSSAAVASNVSSTGKYLTVQEKYSLANIEASKTLEHLRKATLNTSLSFEQNVKMYDTMYLGMQKVGASVEDMVYITEKLAIATGSKMNFDQLIAGVDGLASGTVLASSDLGRFLRSIGLTNEAIKESSNIVDLLKSKLSGFESLDSYSTKIAKLDSSFGSFSKSLMQMPFSFVESNLGKMSSKLEDMTKTMDSINDYFSSSNTNIVNETLKMTVALGGTALAFKTLGTAISLYSKLKTPAVYELQKFNIGLQTQKVLVQESGMALFKKEIAMKTATLGARTLSVALKAIPFFAVTGLVFSLTDAFLENSKKGKMAKDVYAGIKEEVEKLTQVQLEYKKSVLDGSITDAYGDYDKAYRKALKSNSLEDKNERDEAKNKYKILLEERDRYNLELENRKKTKNSGSLKVDFSDQIKEGEKLINQVLNPTSVKIEEIHAKYKNYFDLYKKEGKDTTQLQLALNKELADVHDKNISNNKENIKSLGDLQQAYSLIAQIGMSEYEKSLFSITQQSNEWLKSGLSENEMLYAQGLLIDELNTKRVLDTAKEDLSYQERLLQLKTDSYEKELELINLSYTQKALDIQGLNKPIEDKERLLELETELYNKTLERLQLDTNTQFTETISSFYDDMLEAQLNLNGAAYEFGDAFGDIGNKVQQTTKTLVNMANADLQYRKEKSKIDAKYEAQYKKFGKTTEKGQKLELAHNKELGALKAESFKNDLTSLGSLAGSFKAYFDEQSTGYKILSGVEQGMHAARMAMMLMELPQTLALTAAKWGEAAAGATASVTTAGTGDPYTAPARVAVMVGLMAAAMTMFGGSGGKGGSGVSQSYSAAEVNKFNIEAQYNPTLDKLDRQIELLEAIERNGSAASLSVQSAGLTFERDYKLFANNSMSELHSSIKDKWGGGQGTSTSRDATEEALEKYLGFNLATKNGNNYTINKNELLEDLNFMKLIQAANTDLIRGTAWEVLFDKDWKKAGTPYHAMVAKIAKYTNEFQELLSEYTLSLLDSMDELKDAKDDFKNHYDDITGTSHYANKDLNEAFNILDKHLQGKPLTQYLQEEIENISKLEKFLTDDKIEILLLEDPTKLEEQLNIIEELGRETGLTFENGAEDALNYMKSIELVSAAMVTSRNNIKSFMDSFRSSDELLKIQAASLGLTVANTAEELFKQFETMSNDLLGLTDQELSYLEAAKTHIEAKNEELLNAQKDSLQAQIDAYNDQIDNIKSNVSKLENIISSMSSTIEKLRGSVQGSSYTLEQFYKNMNLSLGYSKSKDYENLEKSLKDTISNSSALFEKTNFRSAWDMQFAQMVAANQLESISTDSLTEIDYLRKIEENTKDTVAALTAQLERIGVSLNSSNSALVDKFNELYGDKASQNNINSSIYEIYTKYDLHKFQTDLTGYKYWEDELSNGSVTIKDLEKAIYEAAKENQHIAKSKLNSFAVGTTNVPYDMFAQIHKSEMIVPATFSDGVRAGDISIGDNKEQITLLKDIKNLLQRMDANIENIDDREDYKMRVS